MLSKIETLLQKNENWILIVILLIFILVNIQGLNWGLPARWHPDELVGVVNLVLHGQATIDQTNFDYPSLPKYFMLFWGYVLQFIGKSNYAFFMVCRFFSVLFGGMTVWTAYAAMRLISSKRWPALFAALLVATSNELAANVHFAHNDPYVTFFSALVIFLSLKYMTDNDKKWLYLAFFAAGLTVCSKYNGGGILLTPFLAYILVREKTFIENKLESLKTFFVGGVLAILGYGVGTPKFLTDFLFYMNGLLPTLWKQANTNKTDFSKPGIISQWDMMIDVFGLAFFILLMVAVIAIIYLLISKKINNRDTSLFPSRKLILLLVSFFVLDLPILATINVQSRFFLPLLVPAALCLAIFVEYMIANMQAKKYEKVIVPALVLCLLLIIYSGLRVASTNINIQNDARYIAAEYLSQLPYETSIEVTNYSPNIRENQFESAREYPLLIRKFDFQTLPDDLQGVYNIGEIGIEKRKPDYLIVSSLLYDKFENEGVCQRHLEDCTFLRDSFAGETNYQLTRTFSYELPWYLPKVVNVFINPDIYIFERVEK